MAGDSKILVFQINGSTLIPAGEIKTKVTTSIIRIDTANLNNNETDEIYISSYDGLAPNSLVIEYQKGKYETLFESKIWFFRVMENNVLMGQKADYIQDLSSDPYMCWNGKKMKLFQEKK